MNRVKPICHLFLIGLFLSLTSSATFAQLLRDPEAEAAYNQGLEKLEQESYDEAIDLFNAAISLDDTYAEAFAARGDVMKEQKDYSAAIQSYRQAIDIDANMALAYNGRGECFRELKQIDMAFNDFQNAIELDHRDPSILANLGMLYVDNRDPVRGLPYLDKSLEQDDQNAKALRSRGFGSALLQQFDEAIVDLEKSISIDPKDHETYATLASVQVFAEDYDKAIEAITSAIDNYEPEERTDPETFFNGYLLRGQWRLELAKERDGKEEKAALYEAVIADCDTVLEEYSDTQPQSGQAFYSRGIALRMLNRFSEAVVSLTDAIQAIPAGEQTNYSAEAYLKRGICWHYQGQDSLARKDFDQASAISYADPLGYLWLGFTYAQEENYREAIRYYGEAIAKNPNFSLAYVNRGMAYLKLKDASKAVDNFNEAIGVEPSNPEHFFMRGFAHLKLAKSQKAADLQLTEFQKAADSFSIAILNDKQHLKSYRGMVQALKGLGRDELAREYESQADQLEKAVQP